jgi:hypothetical protein
MNDRNLLLTSFLSTVFRLHFDEEIDSAPRDEALSRYGCGGGGGD